MESTKHSLHSLARVLFAVVTIFVTLQVALAFTLVMKNGRHVEIPNSFDLTDQMLTYQASPGIQVAIQLVSIDVAATERANNEAAGSFMKRLNRKEAIGYQGGMNQGPTSPRTVTNLDLEAFRRVRVESEIAFERRRKELGLPTLAESRKQAEAQLNETTERVRRSRTDDLETERYWRTRAAELRSEISVTDSQILFVRRRMEETPVNGPLFVSSAFLPVGRIGRSVVSPTLRSPMLRRAGVYSTPDVGPQLSGRFRFGNTRASLPAVTGRLNLRGGRVFSPGRFGNIWSLPLQTYDNSDQRAILQTQLDQLLMQRAGLQARWRELEDDARRSGAYPGWLRP